MPFAAMRGPEAPEEAPMNFTVPSSGTAFDESWKFEPKADLGTSQLTYLDLRNGTHKGSTNERFSRPSLSLSKLYIAQYVFEHGSEDEQDLAQQMIQTSDDEIADELFDAYPNSIDKIAKQYKLKSTSQQGQRWGYSVTSTYDVVQFLLAILRENPHSPVVQAMTQTTPKAADGTRQDFGTAQLPGAKANKFGWSSDGSLHSSATIGDDYIVAAAVYGSEDDLSEYVQRQLGERL
ncbi:hypothetical protein CGERO_03305 [Corynebacterium gerontici]|uniref:Beta-lactamase enzyme family protein n=2 Tax=Corynebacterium gerontici TaxID=2079234 RepID=A0A3G6IYW5_9CORY|nr:hypothetical protein CGERO_03305 [Corynebacterium gerontici]